MELKIKFVRPYAKLPEYATQGSAAFDVEVCSEGPVTIEAGEVKLIPTGIALELPEGCAGLLMARSSLAVRHGLALANGVGLIDSDYRGEISAAVINTGTSPETLMPGTRIAQIMVIRYEKAELKESADLRESVRSCGGFGSTGE